MKSVALKAAALAGAAAIALGALAVSNAQPGDPDQGARYGIIEIGGSGVKATATRLVVEKDERGVAECDLKDFKNLGSIEAGAALPDDESTKRVLDAVQKQLKALQEKEHLPLDQIFVVASSGVADLSHYPALKARLDSFIGRKTDAVTVFQETTYGFDGVLNTQALGGRRSTSVFIDVGSSNIKGAFLVPADKKNDVPEHFAYFSTPFGVKTLAKAARDNIGAGTYEASLQKTVADKLTSYIEEFVGESDENARLDDTKALRRVYLSGGAPWILATYTQPQNYFRYVSLTPANFTAFAKQADSEVGCLVSPASLGKNASKCSVRVLTSQIKRADQRKLIEDDLKSITGANGKPPIFNGDEMKAAAAILKALSAELKFSSRDSVQFARPGRYAWMLGYLSYHKGDTGPFKACYPPTK